jgi:putative oxidoreductase
VFLDNLKKYSGWAPLSLRLVFGVIFVIFGVMKLGSIVVTAGYMDKMGIPLPLFMAWVVALAELLGGLALILGRWTRLAAILLGVEMFVAVFITLHGGPQAFMAPLFAFGAMITLLFLGGGNLSLDKRLAKKAP